jgi:hypothetical protein
MKFRVGQKVVCINADGSGCLKRGQAYTCLATEPEFLMVDCCSGSDHQTHCGWFRTRFRPLLERKTDISALTALLVPGAKILEDA